ncbi:MAG: tyrosine-type recombinase/integrase [Verrucomicrobia subdivision 3 bacterium]|nr:tyrosine-type recombinase/integrase [Limisphaerales bacterium]
MSKLNPQNERIKRDYLRFLKEARGKSEATLDTTRKALSRFEVYTGARDFKTFRREQAIGFKDRLAETNGLRTGESLSHSTQASTLAALKEFFTWLAWQPGYKSRIHVPDIDYFSPSIKSSAKAKATKLRDFPSLEQVRAVIAVMPSETVIDRRNRALVAFAILTGIRDRAMVSLSLRHLDLTKSPPLVRQEPDRVETKFSKTIITYFVPLGDDLKDIVVRWIDELRTAHLFAPNDPDFPRTKVRQGDDLSFRVAGIEPIHWSDASPARTIFRQAFADAGIPYFPPHSFRHTLGHLMQTVCRTPEQMKAWSQNLGHENIGTTLTSYGTIDPHRQGEVIGAISLNPAERDGDLIAKIRSLMQ